MPSDIELTGLKQDVDALKNQLVTVRRVMGRVLDMEDGDELDKALLLGFRNALAYAVKMQGREQETEELLECVRRWRMLEGNRKASVWTTVRTVILGVFMALVGAAASKFFGK